MSALFETYKSLGLSLLPLCAGTKEPATSHGFKSSREEIESTLNEINDQNLAIICGSDSGNLSVLDFETEDDAWAFFQKDSITKSTLCVRTCHGGIHVYFRTLGECPKRQTRLCAPEHSFDICGEGGYVVAPPSSIDHSLCKRKKAGEPDKCPHTNTTTTYDFISSVKEIEMVSGLDESIRKRIAQLRWTAKESVQELGSFTEQFQTLLGADSDLRAIYMGEKVPKSRSEAEYALVIRLVKYGLPDSAIYEILANSKIGKWNESREEYKTLTLTKARKSVFQSKIEWLTSAGAKKKDHSNFVGSFLN